MSDQTVGSSTVHPPSKSFVRLVLSLPPLLLLAMVGVGFRGYRCGPAVRQLKAPAAAPADSAPYKPVQTPAYLPDGSAFHFYAENLVDKTLAGPGNFVHKESANVFGPSAVVADHEGLTEDRRLGEAPHEYRRRLCGDGTNRRQQTIPGQSATALTSTI